MKKRKNWWNIKNQMFQKNWLKIEYKLGINKKKPKTKIFEPLRKKEKWCI